MPEPTPAPAAAQTSTAAPAKTEPVSTPPSSNDSFFSEIEKLASDTPKAEKKEAQSPPPKSQTSTTEKESAATAAAKESDGGTNAKKDAESTATTATEQKPVKAAELRNAYESLKKEHQTLKAELEKARTAKPDDTEKKTLVEQHEAFKKRIEELETELKFTSYEKSDEYKEKYYKPFEDAYKAGRAKVASLKVTDAEGEIRKGTDDDFDTIMRISDDDAAAEKAAEMFGAKAAMVLYHRERVQELNNARSRAIEEYQSKGSEREKTRSAEEVARKAAMEKQQQEIAATFQKLNTDAIEKYPQWFKPEDGDDKGNELLDKGFKMADLAFSGNNLKPEELVKLHSAIRNKAAGFDRLAYKVKQAQNRIKELEGELEAFKKSEPSGGTDRRGKDVKTPTIDDEIDALAR